MAAETRPSPPPRRRRWPWVLAALLLVLAAVAGALAWVVASNAGARWALRTGLAVAGAEGRAEGLRGTVLEGLAIDRLTVRHAAADVDAENLRIAVDWHALWSSRLHVTELSARRIRLNTRPSDEPSEPLDTLRLPLDVDVDRLSVGALDIETDGTRLPVALADIEARASLGRQGHRVLLSNLRAMGPQAEASLRGQAEVAAERPFATSLSLDLNGRQAEHAFDLHAEGSGSLEALALAVRGSGAGIGLDARGRLALLDGFPLRALELRLRGIDPAAWAEGAPQARLDLTADLDTAPGSGADQGSTVLRGPFEIVNRDPRPIDRGGVPVARLAGRLDMPVERLSRVDITALQVGLNGGGRLTGELAWRASSDPADPVGSVRASLAAADVDASKLHGAALPTRLWGPIALTADAARQRVEATLNEKRRAAPMSVRLAAEREGQLVTVERAELTAGEAKASATGTLRLDGSQAFGADVRLERFDPAHWAPGAGLPPARVSASAKVRGNLSPQPAGTAALSIDPGSQWNREPLGGRADVAFAGSRVSKIDAALSAGDSRLQAVGTFGRRGDSLRFNLDAPRLGVLWPGLEGRLRTEGVLSDTLDAPALALTLDGGQLALPGGVRVGRVAGRVNLGQPGADVATARAKGAPRGFAAAPADVDLTIEQVRVADMPQAAMRQAVVQLQGTVARHRGRADVDFLPVGNAAAATLALAVDGGWGNGADGRLPTGWRGTLERFEARRAPFGATLSRPLALTYVPGAAAPAWQWEAGPTEVAVALPGGQTGKLIHDGSRGGGERWETRGRAEGLAWAPELLLDAVVGKPVPAERMLVFDANWDLRFQGALQGTAQVQRRGGDLWVPGAPPQPLGLRTIRLALQAVPAGLAGHSRTTVQAEVEGERFGRVTVNGEAGIVARGGGFGLDPSRPAFADADIDMRDISWIGLFAGDDTELGGQVKGKARIVQEGGRWQASGALDGQGIRVVRVDDGLRLLDGTLKATLDNDRIALQSLRFPAIVRVRPGDSRVREWLSREGQGGHLEITADWKLTEASGHATIIADRFPAIQRADRFVAGSGRVDMDLAPQKMRIAGLFEADAGWIDLGTEAPPTLSSDVYVSRSGGETAKPQPLGIAVDVGAKLGRRFYLQGYGLDTGLTGDLRVVGTGSNLRASGTLRTQGGRFDAYGQTLTVRRGVLTFQGPIDDPLLDIVALRIGPQVEAGVQVSGTARRPRIALISQPEVSDVEKLSWLLLGRGPDDGGGGADASLLLGAATSLLGPKGGEPLSRRLGVDELGVRSGNVGSTRGLLPERTVAGNSTTATTQLASQFFVVGKKVSDKVYLSFEQALSGRDGVVRLSYRLTNRLSVVGKGGTVNGLDLLYYVFFDD